MFKKLGQNIVKSMIFKRVMVVTGIALLIGSVFIAIKPEPFLKLGYAGVFFFNLLSGPGMFLLPTLAMRMNIFGLAFFSALGMALNDSVGWIVGSSGEGIIPASEKVQKISKSIQRFGPGALLVWSLIPFPYDLVGILAGYLKIPYWKYIIPTFLGKFIRFILISGGVVTFFG
ncbi:MAG: VTT domain-containing protein [Candidatus Shapirobacteria bacterium]